MKMILLTFCFLLLACEQEKEGDIPIDIAPIGIVSYTGLDINGEQRTCRPSTENICTMVFTDGDQFAADCEADGNEVIACGCHDYICLVGSEEGQDLHGNLRRCDPLPNDVACTTEFTEEDQFAIDCRASGREAIQCGCHDWICK